LYVDASQDLGPISPYIFGSNYGPWLGMSVEVLPYVTDAGLTFMRWPGGSWGDQNKVTNLQVDQFIALCEQMGWVPMINANLEGGTAEQAAELVKYANLTKGYGVVYWGIGNEPNLYVDDYPVEQFNKDWREWAVAMRAVDPSIKLVGPEISQFYANPDNDYEADFSHWMIEFLKANGDMVDIVSFHRYPFPRSSTSGPPLIPELRENSREWDELIPYARGLIREYTGRDLPVAVTEVNSSYARNTGGEATMDSHYNAIWWGEVLGRMVKNDVEIVAQFDLTKEFGIVGKFDTNPMYYTYRMYQHFGTERIYASTDDPYVSIYAAQRADGALTLMLINLNSEAATQSLTIDNFEMKGPAEVWLFDAEHNAEQQAAVTLESESAVTLPPESITVYVLN
jgi:alpha-L-arabinofuranosidase